MLTIKRLVWPLLSGVCFTAAYLPAAIYFAVWISKGFDYFLVHPIISMFLPVAESLVISWGFIFLVYARFDDDL